MQEKNNPLQILETTKLSLDERIDHIIDFIIDMALEERRNGIKRDS